MDVNKKTDVGASADSNDKACNEKESTDVLFSQKPSLKQLAPLSRLLDSSSDDQSSSSEDEDDPKAGRTRRSILRKSKNSKRHEPYKRRVRKNTSKKSSSSQVNSTAFLLQHWGVDS